MDFFAHQDQARKRTGQLVFLFAGAVITLIVLLNLLLAAVLWGMDENLVGTYRDTVYLADDPYTGMPGRLGLFDYMSIEQWLLVTAGVLIVVLGASAVKWMMLRGGGRRVAESLGGRLLLPQTRDFYERRLLNVVEEMAIASGMPVPPVYVLEDTSINAFAAGYQPSDAVIGVTRGCMTKLSRDQLQGVMAHEFSHIFNGDMRLNIRLMAVLFGILFIGMIGRFMLEAAGRGARVRSNNRNNSTVPFLALGFGLIVIGYGGVFFGNLIKAAVSRQREFLADASAVQFTRNPESIGGALKVIGYGAGSEISSPEREETAHMFFGQAMSFHMRMFATHPPLEDRIRRVEPNWDGRYLPPQLLQQAEAEDAEIAAESDKPSAAATIAALTAAGMGAAAVAAGMNGRLRGVQNQVGDGTDRKDEHQAFEAIDYQQGDDDFAQQDDSASSDTSSRRQVLEETARDTYTARALVVALLLAPEERFVHQQQLDMVQAEQGMDFLKHVLRLLPVLNGFPADERLILVEKAIPALKQLSLSQYQSYRQLLVKLAKADGQIDIFEWCLYRLVLQYLNPHFETVQPIFNFFPVMGLSCGKVVF